MVSNFKPKLGQLVSWKMSGPNMLDNKEHIGIITDVVSENFVEVTFMHHDWVITLNCKGLKLINDVEDSE
jgi:hypothetical protein